MKNKLLLYSDCFIFGGCENIVVNIIQSHEVQDLFEVHYAYARNNDYQAGVDSKFRQFTAKYPLRVLSNTNLFYRIDLRVRSRYVAFILKLPFVLLQRLGVHTVYNFLRLYLFFKKQNPDILHINNGGYPAAPSCLVAVFSAKAAGIKHIVFNVNNLAQPQKSVLDKLVDKYIEKNVSCFITASAMARAKLMENRGFPPDKVVQIFNAMGKESVVKSREALLADFGVTPDKFVLVTVALLTERKGQIVLLKALYDLQWRNVQIFNKLMLFLVGDGEDRGKLENFIKEHRLTDKVIMTGFRSDYYDIINAADLFILPSLRNEDMPLVILSAMGLGKAVVSSKVAGIVEEIRDGVDGVLLDPAALHTLPLVIEELYGNRTLRDRYGESAKQRYRDLFSMEKVVAAYISIYRKILSPITN